VEQLVEVPADLPNPRDGRNFDDWWIGRGGSDMAQAGQTPPWNPLVKMGSYRDLSGFIGIYRDL